MNRHPVRLVLSDDLRRNRLTVFFRLLLAIPHLIWLTLWGIAAFFAAVANWFATLFGGTPPASLHRFLSRFVRYATHVYAYLYLAAGPFPGFTGEPGYPVDVEIGPPARQNRWVTGFRLVLVVPALILVSVLVGSTPNLEGSDESLAYSGAGLAFVAAFLGWFYALARARMPRGLRDLIAYALCYGAQTWAYLLMLTDRYPFSDPLSAVDRPPTVDHPLRLESSDDLRRNRLTVFFRLLLAIPHLIWLTLWGIAAFFAAVANWFATLFGGTPPASLNRFLSAYVRYQLHVGAYLYLVANPFPGFTGTEGSYPIDLSVAGRERQNRWTVGFRLALAVPALLLVVAYGALAYTVAFLGWFAALFTGRMPPGLRNAGALALRYTAQTYAYLLIATDAYPYSGPCLAPPRDPEPLAPAPAPLAPPAPPR
ncbi:MAG TPA: DUF4389 domain-containing protein [Thermoanaerobaculia bacterium]|nr:DUF4389 domain-containing protein [Thermoanaerobaculia bacterium]